MPTTSVNKNKCNSILHTTVLLIFRRRRQQDIVIVIYTVCNCSAIPCSLPDNVNNTLGSGFSVEIVIHIQLYRQIKKLEIKSIAYYEALEYRHDRVIIIMSLIKPKFAQVANTLCHVSVSSRNAFSLFLKVLRDMSV